VREVEGKDHLEREKEREIGQSGRKREERKRAERKE
jgi:hypothetical protein